MNTNILFDVNNFKAIHLCNGEVTNNPKIIKIAPIIGVKIISKLKDFILVLFRFIY